MGTPSSYSTNCGFQVSNFKVIINCIHIYIHKTIDHQVHVHDCICNFSKELIKTADCDFQQALISAVTFVSHHHP